MEEIRLEAHGLKGASSSIGGMLLSQVAASIERSAVLGVDMEIIRRHSGALEMAWLDTIEALEIFVNMD